MEKKAIGFLEIIIFLADRAYASLCLSIQTVKVYNQSIPDIGINVLNKKRCAGIYLGNVAKRRKKKKQS